MLVVPAPCGRGRRVGLRQCDGGVVSAWTRCQVCRRCRYRARPCCGVCACFSVVPGVWCADGRPRLAMPLCCAFEIGVCSCRLLVCLAFSISHGVASPQPHRALGCFTHTLAADGDSRGAWWFVCQINAAAPGVSRQWELCWACSCMACEKHVATRPSGMCRAAGAALLLCGATVQHEHGTSRKRF